MNDLKSRTKKFTVDVLRFCAKLPKEMELLNFELRIANSVGLGALNNLEL